MSNPFEPILSDMRSRLSQQLASLPAKAGAVIVQHSNEAFLQQGWTDDSLDPWDARKSKATKDEGRAILIKTGRLRRSIRIISITPYSVTVGTDVPYARIHNEGGPMHHGSRDAILNFDETPAHGLWKFGKARTVTQQRGIKAIRRVTYKAHTTTMPQRKFLGNSRRQTEKIKEVVEISIMKALKITK